MFKISLNNVTLEFKVYEGSNKSLKTKVYNFSTGGKISKDRKGIPSIIALRNISFEINEGDRVALIGHNGAGKSTLLRVMSGVYKVDDGAVIVEGKISTLFQSSLGFDLSATGYENIMLRGLILGFTRQEIEKKIKQIADLSDLGEFLHMPLRTCSTGMRLRLAFAVSTSIQPEILLIDEWIGAGDRQFRKLAEKKLLELVNHSRVLVMATHNLDLAQKICNKAVLLNHGQKVDIGPVNEIIRAYRAQADVPVLA